MGVSVDAPARPIFGQITIDQMAENEALTRYALSVVRDACKRAKGRFTVASVATGLKDGSMRLYGVLQPDTAALKATVVARPSGGVFEILIAGPRFEDVAPFMDVLEKYARAAGCTRMTLWGVPFFATLLPASWFAREVRYDRVLGDAG